MKEMIVLMWKEWKGSLTQCLAKICGHDSLFFFGLWISSSLLLEDDVAGGARDFVVDLNNDLCGR